MTKLAREVALVAGLAVAGVVWTAGTTPAALAALGVGGLVAGSTTDHEHAVAVGGVGLLAGILAAGAVGLRADLLVAATVASVVAWDSATHALGLQRQTVEHASTQRGEAVHVGLTLVATAAIGTVATLAYFAGGQVPLVAGVLVAGGAILAALGLRL